MKAKKLTAVILCAITVLSLFAIASCTKNKQVVSVSSLEAQSEPLHLAAHRGLSSQAPENTLAALRLAAYSGYYACEFDIRATVDGVWVLMHDENIKRMTNGKGKISEMTYAELMEYTIDSGNNCKDYPDQKIPNISEVLDICEQYSIRPIIEIKSGTAENVESLMALLKSRGMLSKAVIIAFDSEYLSAIRKTNKKVELWLLVDEITDDTLTLCKELKAGVDFNYKTKGNSDYISKINDAGLISAAWTVDSLEAASELYSSGVNYITTNSLAP